MSVNKERVRLLVDALRSGRYQQFSGALRSPDGRRYCCLGVATKVALDAGLEIGPDDKTDHFEPWHQAYQVMCPAVADWYGFRDGNPVLIGELNGSARTTVHASHWNDDYSTDFSTIADMFEATYITNDEVSAII